MATKIRLGWETQIDQLTLAIDFTIVGVGLIVLGAYLGGAGGVMVIVLGTLITIVAVVRFHGWRSLLWPRNLTVGPDGIADDTKKSTPFDVKWTDLASVGVITERDRITLVFTLKNATRTYRIPRKAGVLPALREAATCPVTELPPPPDVDRVVVNVGARQGWFGVVGGALAGFFGVSGLIAAFDSHYTTGARIMAGIIGTPLALIGLAVLLSLPVLLRKRLVVVDATAFTWDDPSEQSFTVPWTDLAGAAIDSTVVRNMNSGNRYSVHIVLLPHGSDFAENHREMRKFAKDDRYVIPLGDAAADGARIGDAIRRFAPDVWRGASEKRGRFGIT